MTQVTLQAENVAIRRGGRLTIRRLDILVEAGEIVGLCGPSGCGKSTLLLAMFGLIPLETGRIIYSLGALSFTWPPTKTNASEFLFRQSCQLLLQNSLSSLNPRRTLLEDFHRVSKLHRPHDNKTTRQRLIEQAAANAELPCHALDQLPSQISGGEAQRAALARALLVGPYFLACDEIWASLDLLTALKVVQLLRSFRSKGMTLLIVSHQIELLSTLCDRIVELSFFDSALDR